MHKRTAHRWRLLTTITALVFLAFGSFWLVELMLRSDGSMGPGGYGNEPDYIVEKFSVVRMTPEGQPRYLLSGAKLTHRPVEDVSEVEQPVMRSVAPGQSAVTIVARKARIRHAENQVDLSGAVDIARPATPASKAMRLKTEALTVFPDEDRMESSVAVQMAMGEASVKGVGMKADNALRQLDFASSGQLIYPPNPRR
ncbi:MAG: LPS export ABC transporter periplasmic protein LptC [Pseudomonadota bacterium]